MRKMIGFTGSHVLYFLADRVDAIMHRTGLRWLFPVYSKLLVRSADVENWGGGGGAWGAMWAVRNRLESIVTAETGRVKRVCLSAGHRPTHPLPSHSLLVPALTRHAHGAGSDRGPAPQARYRWD